MRYASLLSPEARLLLCAIAEDPGSGAFQSALADPDLDWGRLIWLADKEKATPALVRALRSLPPGAVPSEHLRQLSSVASITDFRMLRLQTLLLEVLDTFAARGIDVVLLKGAGLATTVYESFLTRPMYDLDLLVREHEASEAWESLHRAGWSHDRIPSAEPYTAHHHLTPLDDPGGTGLAVELHTAVGANAIALDAATIWKHARPITIAGRRTWVPCLEHSIIHLSTHFAWNHSLASGAWRSINDLRCIVARANPDWDALVKLAHEVRAATSCYWTFRIARLLGGVAVPDHVMSALRPPRSEAVLRFLERHYVAGLFRFAPGACPSVALSKLFWIAGIAPRWSGHGPTRPWHADERFLVAGVGDTQLRRRMGGHLSKLRLWSRYLAAVLIPPFWASRLSSLR